MKLNALRGLGINLKIEDLFDEEGFSLADVNDTLMGDQGESVEGERERASVCTCASIVQTFYVLHLCVSLPVFHDDVYFLEDGATPPCGEGTGAEVEKGEGKLSEREEVDLKRAEVSEMMKTGLVSINSVPSTCMCRLF